MTTNVSCLVKVNLLICEGSKTNQIADLFQISVDVLLSNEKSEKKQADYMFFETKHVGNLLEE